MLRRLATLTFCTSLTLPYICSVQADEFERFLKNQQAGVEAIKNDYQAYKSRYLAAFENYKAEVEKEWQTAEFTNQEIWASYSPDLQKKQVIDFAFNEIRLSYKGDNQPDKEQVATDIAGLITLTQRQAVETDPVNVKLMQGRSRTNIPKESLLGNVSAVYGSRIEALEKMSRAAVQYQEQTEKGIVTIVKIPLAAELPITRSEKFLPAAFEAAQKWQIEPALIMAIAHTESHFNPLARSHIPAFGLMQIVPATAGKDASKLIYGEAKLLTSEQLYNPEFNLQTGTAYLNMLQTRYLKGIKNPKSRLYCAIAAYNTGTGNVAKAFIGQASMQKSYQFINRLTPEQVFKVLRKGLPYEETRNYLSKVTNKLEHYRQILNHPEA